MKHAFLFSLLSIFIFSCGNDPDKQKSDSLIQDSVLRSLTSATSPPVNVNTSDSAKIAIGLPELKEGDLVFQNLDDAQSIAFGKATHSRYNNVGIVFIRRHDQSFVVLNVKDSIHITPVNEWINQGKDHKIAVLRLKNSSTILDAKKSDEMKSLAKKLMGRKEDLYFSQDNDELYPSELAWKIYKNGVKLDLCTPEKLSGLDLTVEPIRQQMKKKYPSGPPLDEEVITPEELYTSALLEKIYER